MKLQDAIAYFEKKTEIAAQLGITKPSLNQWGYWIPEKHAMKLAMISPLVYSRGLYSGNEKEKIYGKMYAKSAYIQSFQMLQRRVSAGDVFYFLKSEILVSSKFLNEQELKFHFKNHPMYERR